ncbi:MAG: SH3 domain-containing protein, partial [Acidobacteriota bacterium]|nr:SH3 domain-containing protein [Acidobacteriota bacterium]
MVTPRFFGPRRAALLFPICGALLIAACHSSTRSAGASELPAIGVAYVGPVSMNLRQDVAAKSSGVTEVKHGDRLDIIEVRRRLARVRTVEGSEGWVDANLLLSAQQMDELRKLADDARQMPSQGAATVFEALNMHSEPNRSSPSFHQIPEGGSVDVLAHRATPRVAARPKAAALAKAVAVPKATKPKESKKAAAMLLPPPAAPALPADWEKMSRPRASDLPDYQAPEAPAPPPLDDWDLVRTKDGTAGWVLARMLYMSVPDDVAQYAEGNRITAYLSIGDVQDGGQVKHNWLWTTAASSLKTAEFDSFRVFVWSKSRHRYETAFVERNVTGFFPVELAEVPADKKASGPPEKGFSLLVQDRDGALYKRTYGFSGYHVRLISKTAVAREEAAPGGGAVSVVHGTSPQPRQTEGWWRRFMRRWRGR